MDTEADERRRLKEDLFEDNKKKYQKAPKRKGPPQNTEAAQEESTAQSDEDVVEATTETESTAPQNASTETAETEATETEATGTESSTVESGAGQPSFHLIFDRYAEQDPYEYDVRIVPFSKEGLPPAIEREKFFQEYLAEIEAVTESFQSEASVHEVTGFGVTYLQKGLHSYVGLPGDLLYRLVKNRGPNDLSVKVLDFTPVETLDLRNITSLIEYALATIRKAAPHIQQITYALRLTEDMDVSTLADLTARITAVVRKNGIENMEVSGVELREPKSTPLDPSSSDSSPSDADTRTHFLADHATDQDLLGYLPYAMGIASFVRDRRTALPLTIAIDGAWGTGKSSLMKMLRNELDPDRPDEDTIKPPAGWLRTQWDTLSRTLSTLIPIGKLTRGISEAAAKLGTKFADLIAPAAEKTADETTAPDREFVTVFVNAWRHGHGTQLKATLVNEILKSLTARLGPDFLMSLNLNRIDRLAVLNSAVKGFLTNSTTLFLAVLATIILLLSGLMGFDIPVVSWDMLGASQEVKALMHAQPHLPGGASAGAGILLYLWKKIPAPDLKQYLQEPDYLNLMGDSAQVEADFRRILAVLKERDLHLALFVDDLDRCSPADCAAVVEALNTFFGQDRHECLFVLGMHREMVATSLEVAYCDLVAKIDGLDSLAEQRPFGRRFLEKIVQFVVTLPEPGEDATRKYLDALTEGKRRASLEEIRALQKADTAQKDQPASPATSGKLRTVTGVLSNMMPWPLSRTMDTTFDTLIDRMESGNIDIAQAKADAEKLSKLEEDIEERKNANENDYVAAFQEVRAVIRTNPRQYKRFFNKLRFYRLLNVAEENPMLVDAGEAVLALEHPELHARARKLPGIGSFHKLAQAAGGDMLDEEAKKLIATLDKEVGVRDLREKVAAL